MESKNINNYLWQFGGRPEISMDDQRYADAIANLFGKARTWLSSGTPLYCKKMVDFCYEETGVPLGYNHSDYDLHWLQTEKKIGKTCAQHIKNQILSGSDGSCPCCNTNNVHVNGKVPIIDGLQWMYCFSRQRGKYLDYYHRWFIVAGVVDDVVLCPLCIYSGRTLFYGKTYEEIWLGLCKELKQLKQEVYVPLLFVLSYRQLFYAWCNHTMDPSKFSELMSIQNQILSYEHTSGSQIIYSATSFIEVGSVFQLALSVFDYQYVEIVDLLRWYSGCMAYMFYSSKTFGHTHSSIDDCTPDNIDALYDAKRLRNLELFALYYSNICKRLPIDLLECGMGMMNIPWTMDRYINRLDGIEHVYHNCKKEIAQGLEAYNDKQTKKVSQQKIGESYFAKKPKSNVNDVTQDNRKTWEHILLKMYSKYPTICKTYGIDNPTSVKCEQILACSATLKDDLKEYIGKKLEEYSGYKTHENDPINQYGKDVQKFCINIGEVVEEMADILGTDNSSKKWPGSGGKINFSDCAIQCIKYVDGPLWHGYFRDTPYLSFVNNC